MMRGKPKSRGAANRSFPFVALRPSVNPMARMTPREATAVNVLLGYFVGRDELPPREVVRSLETLANRAHNRLQAGWDEVAVRRQWPHAYNDEPNAPNG